VFNVRAFGARGDGCSLDTVAVRAAAQALRERGGGVLLFPFSAEGSTYLTGSFNLSSNTVLRIEHSATILGAVQGDQWPLVDASLVWPQFGIASDCRFNSTDCRFWHQSLVFSWGASNITIDGGGTIDGNSSFDTWWGCSHDLQGPPCNGYGRPNLLFVSNATQVAMQDVTVQNSPDWTLHFSSVTGLRVRNITVLNPEHAPNADGIDIDCSQDVIVEDSTFKVGDDALCVKSGMDYYGRLYGRPSKDIIFRRIYVGTGHGITIGSEMSGGVFNVTFEDITMEGTLIGARLKTQRGRGGVISGITYRNVEIRNVESRCFELTMNYQPGIAPTNATATPLVENILYENITCASGQHSFFIDGIPEQPIRNVQFRNVVLGGEVGPELGCAFVACTCDDATTQAGSCPSCCQGAVVVV